jgi:transcriptional regulator with XRE-family HTH domain
MSQRALAQHSGISAATLSRYENDMRIYHWETLSHIADGLDASADYILCRTDMKTSVSGPPEQKKFIETFSRLDAKGRSVVMELAAALAASERDFKR